MVKFGGDFGALERFGETVEQIAALPRTFAGLARDRLQELADASAGAGVDPYGEPWVPLKAGGSASLGSGPEVQQAGDGLTVDVPFPLNFRQTGTTRRRGGGVHAPARPLAPDDARGLPSSWESALDETAAGAYADATRGLG